MSAIVADPILAVLIVPFVIFDFFLTILFAIQIVGAYSPNRRAWAFFISLALGCNIFYILSH